MDKIRLPSVCIVVIIIIRDKVPISTKTTRLQYKRLKYKYKRLEVNLNYANSD